MDRYSKQNLAAYRKKHPEKFITPGDAFDHIRRGSSLFAGTACALPQHLVRSLAEHADTSPHGLLGTDVVQMWTLGVAPFADEYYERNFRNNSFFIGDSSREAVNSGHADYTPIFLSEVPALFSGGTVPVDVALVQTSLPDSRGNVSLGISVDIVKAAAENARMIIAQVNGRMPAVRGDSFIRLDDIDYIIPRDEALLEYSPRVPDDISRSVGRHVAKLVSDGDTIQVGYGSMPNAILSCLSEKNDLGVHTELLTDGIIALVKKGVVTNRKKSFDRNATVATFCMGTARTYRYIHDNPAFRFMPVDYTNSVRRIMSHRNMTAINSALQIDLTGQATSESIGSLFYSGIGGQADFMRGAILAPGGRSVLAMRSTSNDGKRSRVVPRLDSGAGVTLNRGDVHYVVTEHGVAYLHGKSIQERALALISIAHPDYREQLLKDAIEMRYVRAEMQDYSGKITVGPKETRTTMLLDDGSQLTIRPIHPTDEPALRELFYALSQKSIYTRFMSRMKWVPRKQVKDFVYIDHRTEVSIVATVPSADGGDIVALGGYYLNPRTNRAEVAFTVHDDYQNRHIGTFLFKQLVTIARRNGIAGFTAEVLEENRAMQAVFNNSGLKTESKLIEGVFHYTMQFD